MRFDNKPLNFTLIRERLDILPLSLSHFNRKISAIILFGSLATGKETPLSDVDLAVLYGNHLNDNELINTHREVYSIVSDVLESDDIDLINLNTAPLSMQYGAIKSAKILLLNNREEYIDFWDRTVKYYLDFKPLLDECNQTLLETLTRRIVHG
ncbi:type VII toxin-antitoxin system MntA family adenylyltransferase antitoxin [Paradesulfitobacterium ferrireducens]|uniref:type VII toxin-antitoxin system MntA family adenylyltransferase antitoxin n=1 Tax=Paradesulfitobacterium ferrireducens TaxID=2816476 RepID=UPI001A8C0B75|nr:nucleotidyltransferase domain-containing protein [Paradesulfitobacterium ferrireducens]